MSIKRILVYCGSSKGNNPLYTQVAKDLGLKIAMSNRELVYGAGNVGLMGVLADEVLANNALVRGVIPQFLKTKEVCHSNLTELIVTETMQERKKIMAEMSDAIITLPGGFGTLEELAEMLTLAQLGQYRKPISLLNINGYFDSLIVLFENMISEGFLKSENKDLLIVSDHIDSLFEKLEAFIPQEVPKWIN